MELWEYRKKLNKLLILLFLTSGLAQASEGQWYAEMWDEKTQNIYLYTKRSYWLVGTRFEKDGLVKSPAKSKTGGGFKEYTAKRLTKLDGEPQWDSYSWE